jgi:hypothetical protein
MLPAAELERFNPADYEVFEDGSVPLPTRRPNGVDSLGVSPNSPRLHPLFRVHKRGWGSKIPTLGGHFPHGGPEQAARSCTTTR